MKNKKIRIIRPEFEVEFSMPVVGFLYLVVMLPRLIKVKKCNFTINDKVVASSFVIVIPKFKVVDGT